MINVDVKTGFAFGANRKFTHIIKVNFLELESMPAVQAGYLNIIAPVFHTITSRKRVFSSVYMDNFSTLTAPIDANGITDAAIDRFIEIDLFVIMIAEKPEEFFNRLTLYSPHYATSNLSSAHTDHSNFDTQE